MPASLPTEYDFAQIAARLGLARFSLRSQVMQLRRLADREGMPLPKNPRWRAGEAQRHADAIGRRSVWHADRFDEWHEAREGRAPAQRSGMARRAHGPEALRAQLRARAEQLAGAVA